MLITIKLIDPLVQDAEFFKPSKNSTHGKRAAVARPRHNKNWQDKMKLDKEKFKAFSVSIGSKVPTILEPEVSEPEQANQITTASRVVESSEAFNQTTAASRAVESSENKSQPPLISKSRSRVLERQGSRGSQLYKEAKGNLRRQNRPSITQEVESASPGPTVADDMDAAQRRRSSLHAAQLLMDALNSTSREEAGGNAVAPSSRRRMTVWEQAVDPDSGNSYFYHPRTHETAWSVDS